MRRMSEDVPLEANRYALARRRMVERDLRGRGITSTAVLNVMARVPRELFVPRGVAHLAYEDCALAIDCGQTISQPYMVALMTQALNLTGRERVLEIGTGSGYQTAVLAELAERVTTIERHAPLSRAAQTRLANLHVTNVEFVIGDGSQGWPAGAPFDRILVTAAAGEIPPPLFEQLAEGGVLVIPLVEGGDGEILYAVHKIAGKPQKVPLVACRFVPLVTDAK